MNNYNNINNMNDIIYYYNNDITYDKIPYDILKQMCILGMLDRAFYLIVTPKTDDDYFITRKHTAKPSKFLCINVDGSMQISNKMIYTDIYNINKISDIGTFQISNYINAKTIFIWTADKKYKLIKHNNINESNVYVEYFNKLKENGINYEYINKSIIGYINNINNINIKYFYSIYAKNYTNLLIHMRIRKKLLKYIYFDKKIPISIYIDDDNKSWLINMINMSNKAHIYKIYELLS